MDNVFARVKRRTKNQFFKLISDHTLFQEIDLTVNSFVSYEPGHNLDEDAWFKIDNFNQKDYCLDILKGKFDSKDYNDLEMKSFPNIDYIFSFQGNDFYFQKITPSLYLKRKMILYLGEAAKIEDSSNRIVIKDLPDAVYLSQENILIFRNLATISSMFKGIDTLYRKATQTETESFLQLPFIELKNSYDADKVSKPNRRRIALALDSFSKLTESDKQEIILYINNYCENRVPFNQVEQTFHVSSNDELKLLLYGIEERFYTTNYGNQRRIANSIQTLD